MKVLLDTCCYIWFISKHKQLPKAVRDVIIDQSVEVYLSVVSTWEMVIKYKLGRLTLDGISFEGLLSKKSEHRINDLSLEENSLKHLLKLADYHSDPFDRVLICQAIEHGMTILTPDKAIQKYPVKSYWDNLTI